MNVDNTKHRFFVLLFIKADLSAIALVLIQATVDVRIDCLLKVIENMFHFRMELLDPKSSTTTGIRNTDENVGNKEKWDTEWHL